VSDKTECDHKWEVRVSNLDPSGKALHARHDLGCAWRLVFAVVVPVIGIDIDLVRVDLFNRREVHVTFV